MIESIGESILKDFKCVTPLVVPSPPVFVSAGAVSSYDCCASISATRASMAAANPAVEKFCPCALVAVAP